MEWFNERRSKSNFSAITVCDYLLLKFKSGYSTTHVNTIRSAINFFSASKLDLENNIFLKRLFKYFYKEKPNRARYLTYWPVDKLLEFLKSWHPLSSLSLKQITLKTISLIALSSSDRGQTLHLASVKSMVILEDRIQFIVREKVKNTRKTIRPTIINCLSSNIQELNVAQYVKAYIELTKDFRGEDGQLFISWASKRPVSRQTLARWLKTVLDLAGIDTSTFKSHSYRGAGLSKAFQRGASLHEIVKAGNWSNPNIFKSYYNAPSCNSEVGALILED